MSHIPASAVPHAKPHDGAEQESPATGDASPTGAPPADMQNAGLPPQADAPPGSEGEPKDGALPAKGPGKRPGSGAGPILAIAGVAAVGIGGIVAALALRGGDRTTAKGDGKRRKGGRRKAA